MRLEHLTTAEILRTQHPETDLERVLFDRIQDALAEAESAAEDAREAEQALDDYDCEHCHIIEVDLEISEEKVEKLEALLDEHDIDHSEI